MATKRDIREAMKAELDSVVPTSGNPGHVPAEHIRQENPEGEEDLPALSFDDAWRDRPINEASTAPIRIKRDQDGDATEEFYGHLREARFSILFWFTDEVEKEACYEAVVSNFEQYEDSPWPASNFHADAKWVRTRDTQSDDFTDMNPARHGDRLLVSIVFLREHGHAATAIETVDHEVDADNDGTTDATWSTT